MIANNLALLFNGLTLALALGLLILVLWQDPNSTANRYFALFLFSALIWASGSLLSRAAAYVNAGPGTIQAGLRLLDMGFSASTLTLYTYSAVAGGVRARWFRDRAGWAGAGLQHAASAMAVRRAARVPGRAGRRALVPV